MKTKTPLPTAQVTERRPKVEVDALLTHHRALRSGMLSALATTLTRKRTEKPQPMCCEFANEVIALRIDLERVNGAVHALLCAFGDERDEAEMELRALLDEVMGHV